MIFIGLYINHNPEKTLVFSRKHSTDCRFGMAYERIPRAQGPHIQHTVLRDKDLFSFRTVKL